MRIMYFGENKEEGSERVAVIRFTDDEFDLYKYIENYEHTYGDNTRKFAIGGLIGIERNEKGVWINESYISVHDFTDFNDFKANYKEAKKEFKSLKKQATETEMETATDPETAETEETTEETTEGVITMKEIKVAEAMNRKYVLIDMVHPVKGYESYDFHVGTKCKINGYPFQIMAENGELSFEAGAIALTAWKRPAEDVVKFVCNEKIAIICVYEGYAKAYEYILPKKIRQQSFIIK